MSDKKGSFVIPPAAQARLATLQSIALSQAEDDANISSIASRALAEFIEPDEILAAINAPAAERERRAPGWSIENLRVAYHAMKEVSKMPAAMKMLHERHVNRIRLGNTASTGGEAQAFVLPTLESNAPNLPAIAAPEKEDE